jgi:beta-glucan synthesis-associated protein KRE6
MATNYSRINGRSPIHSPLHSPSAIPGEPYAGSGSGGSSSHSNAAADSLIAPRVRGTGVVVGSESSQVGGHEFGPYAPLNRRANGNGAVGGAASSFETDSYSDSAKDRLLKNGAGMQSSAALAYSGGNGYGPDVEGLRKSEPDDYLHDPRGADKHSNKVSLGGALNILTLLILVLGLLMLFAGYPIVYHFVTEKEGNKGAYGLGGTNGTGQVASLSSVRPLVDPDTPAGSKTWTSPVTNTKYNLQFSDEFEREGRTFWPGDDQYWEAVNIWYGATQDLEWYSPENVNTTGGAMVITMTDKPSHNLNFQSGMVQSWNNLCFSGGYIEFSIIQPGSHSTKGYWPGAWIMGNLGRPGYLGTTDGMWPYSYQGCDTGILANQTNAQGGPVQAVKSTAQYAANGQLSKLPGMRTPSCTCSGEDHPGPKNSVGRSAPEIDILEAQIQTKGGVADSYASQSLQTAPFDESYFWVNTTPAATIFGTDTEVNTYVGGPFQEAVSSVSLIPRRGFMDVDMPEAQKWVTYGLEWEPDWNLNGGGSVTWYVDGKATWQATGASLPPSTLMQISQRQIPVEPMSIIMNLGISPGFQSIDFDPTTGVNFPAQMKFDYVRVYQEKGKEKLSCDPDDYPTADYIERHIDVYNNPNITQWKQTKYKWPKNKLTGC